MQTGQFNHRKVIRLVYSRKTRDVPWALVREEINPEVVAALGGEFPFFDPSIEYPERMHIKLIHEALQKARLDGGQVSETFDDGLYEVVFALEKSK